MEFLKFGASWCASCKTLESTMKNWDAKVKGYIKEMNFDSNASLARQYGVRSLPTVVVLKDNEVVDRLTIKDGITEEKILSYL